MFQSDKKLTSQIIKATCGREYRASILYTDEQDLRDQRSLYEQFDCLDCIDKKREPKAEAAPPLFGLRNS
jgi:hypothetical protein